MVLHNYQIIKGFFMSDKAFLLAQRPTDNKKY